MGHSHSSSHKRLKSISTSRAYECTEVVDLEFSEVAASSEPTRLSESESKSTKSIRDTPTVKSATAEPVVNGSDSAVKIEPASTQVQAQYPKDLLVIIEHLKDVEKNITNMSHDDFFVYFPTLKDDLHNCWQKVYGINEVNTQTKQRKIEVINNIKILLRKINSRL